MQLFKQICPGDGDGEALHGQLGLRLPRPRPRQGAAPRAGQQEAA